MIVYQNESLTETGIKNCSVEAIISLFNGQSNTTTPTTVRIPFFLYGINFIMPSTFSEHNYDNHNNHNIHYNLHHYHYHYLNNYNIHYNLHHYHYLNNVNIHYNIRHYRYHYLNNDNIHGYHHERNKKSLSFMAIICIHFFLDFY